MSTALDRRRVEAERLAGVDDVLPSQALAALGALDRDLPEEFREIRFVNG